MATEKYRIVQRGVNHYAIEQRFLCFWIDALEHNWFWTLEEARDCIKKWEANKAVRGTVYEP